MRAILALLALGALAPDPELAREVRDKGWIVFGARTPGKDWDLFHMRPDGSDLRNLTNTPAWNEGLPRFSPDGKRLLYRRIAAGDSFDNNRHGMQGELVLAGADASCPEVFGKDGEYPWASWSPDGTRLACLSPKGVAVYPASAGPAWNADRAVFLGRLGEAGVETVDVTDDLWRAKGGADLYLRNDTHWTPRGLGLAADRIAAGVRPSLEGIPREDFEVRREAVAGTGDLLRSLEVGPGAGLVPSQEVKIERILRGGEPVRGGDDAPVLLLGDSFTNVYSRKELEWGEGAGLGEQIMARLGLKVQVIAIDGGGATAVRETLAARPSALRKKKAVVWACSARDLYDEDVSWETVPLAEEKP